MNTTDTNDILNEMIIEVRHGRMSNTKALEIIAQEATKARIDELQEVMAYWFRLSVTVPRLQSSPPPVKQFINDRIAKLKADNRSSE